MAKQRQQRTLDVTISMSVSPSRSSSPPQLQHTMASVYYAPGDLLTCRSQIGSNGSLAIGTVRQVGAASKGQAAANV